MRAGTQPKTLEPGTSEERVLELPLPSFSSAASSPTDSSHHGFGFPELYTLTRQPNSVLPSRSLSLSLPIPLSVPLPSFSPLTLPPSAPPPLCPSVFHKVLCHGISHTSLNQALGCSVFS